MSVRAAPLNTAAADLGSAIAEVQPEAAALAEGNSFATQSADHPLHREVVVSIKASLNDLCLQKSKGTWAPTPEALKSIFQQVQSNPHILIFPIFSPNLSSHPPSYPCC